MNDQEIEQCRQKLHQLKSELLQVEESSKESSETVELDQSRVGRLSRMDAMQAQQMALETSRRRKEQLQRIEGALKRLDSDDFGYCLMCGEEIDVRRLLANPANTHCIKCADK